MTSRFFAAFLLVAACGEVVTPPPATLRRAEPASGDVVASAGQTLYGPDRFTRSTGPATRFSRTISAAGFEAPFVLHVRNGAVSGASRVSSARVTLAGVELLGPKDFNKSRDEWSIPITLGASATLEVELTSKPGSYLDVSVTGTPRSAWMQLSPRGTPPTKRYFHSTVYDAANDRMIVFGGPVEGADILNNDTWVLVGASGAQGAPVWTQLAPAGGPPAARGGQSAVYDATTNRMIVFGGGTNGFMQSDVWVLSNANGLGGTPTWTQLSPGAGPAGRTYHSAVYDQAGNRLIIFGGNLSEGNCFIEANDSWVLSNANGLGGTPAWTQLSPTGGPPAIRNLGGAVYHAATNRMTYLWGRLECSSQRDDIWTLTNANGTGGTPSWSQLTPTGAPSPRNAFSMIFDAANQRAIIFGGNIGTSRTNEVWILSSAVNQAGSPAWTQLSPTGTPPSPRSGASAVYNAALNRMIVFSGFGSGAPDIWVLTQANGLP